MGTKYNLGVNVSNMEKALPHKIIKKAYMWFDLAIHNGHSDGQKAKDTMAK